jgi:8-oxo-dGTP pyrophosphatase MutT (NUDIX family)
MRRRGEIVMVVPRGEGKVLLHTKPHYPEGVYRLPTGGIHPGEDAVDAAKREGYEEIGFKPKDLELLGVLDNIFWVDREKLVYPSFVFQTKEYTRKPKPTDRNELISGFLDVDAAGLQTTAIHLASLPGGWRDWGRFRAAPHAWLADKLMRSA